MEIEQANVSLTERIAGHWLAFGTPRKLPKPDRLAGRVVVVDIAFAAESAGRKNSFERTTLRFIEALGPRLVAWIDHHDSRHHALFAEDERFVLSTKAQHGACPQMLNRELVARLGPADTVLCHSDFDGLASAAKWICGGVEPYPGCDSDARVADTRIGALGPIGSRLDRAIRARPRQPELMRTIVAHLCEGLKDASRWQVIDEAAAELLPREQEARRLAQHYQALSDELVAVDLDRLGPHLPYDKTLLLLLGQQLSTMAMVADGDTVTFAAAFDSGIDFLDRFSLSGGMPTLVSLHRKKLDDALLALGVSSEPASPSGGRGQP